MQSREDFYMIKQMRQQGAYMSLHLPAQPGRPLAPPGNHHSYRVCCLVRHLSHRCSPSVPA